MKAVPIIDAITLASVCPNCSAVQAARALGISFGDDCTELPFKYVPPAEEEAAVGNGATAVKVTKAKPSKRTPA
jgi:hypothetical protein